MTNEEKVSNFRWVVLVLLFLNMFLAFLAVQSMPPLFKEISGQIPLTKVGIPPEELSYLDALRVSSLMALLACPSASGQYQPRQVQPSAATNRHPISPTQSATEGAFDIVAPLC